MNSCLFTQNLEQIDHQQSINQLEEGKVLFFPEYFFSSVDSVLLSEHILDGSRKNVSYDIRTQKLNAYKKETSELATKLTVMMHGYAEFAHQLIQKVLPSYVPHLQWGRTSFRPAQIQGRVSSKRKDDTRLHVDSFSASPVHGLRILRVFCNVNPHEPRVWNLGEPFTDVLHHFAPRIAPYSKVKASLLKLVKATKTLRSPYDHYMLHLHDTMKLDDAYQAKVAKVRIEFPAKSTWIVFTDHVSHAALSGQHLLEQTFYLPVDKMAVPDHSPLNQWKKIRPEMSSCSSQRFKNNSAELG
ncbi:Kdo hydroxylase family protein [Fluoribacter dumoffii]|uniref:Kdo hydroxylase family protein n=1 Tax=Fluoribacter dumoffii TaxID=463 RepID=UPI0022438B6A|nr:Kdo hydroxylase family protein [Fluoribacter dumoffii]MCW8418983.1 Kdo hydroxylase family protein [Fluoribacter dumoffii]MCW8453173.1 Kdo hydroxylase family protein [Fluoribacter dumoffii]MCW8459606.1 Kdo hydroxylase family protein [Fluoribacter dumoffii]MCW8482966.1 Kdo hydroxylase family protein [Fluoribacter dumoffii]